MRERGQHEQALRLAEDMLWLDERQGSPDGSLTADLLTHRSTLLWAQGHYSEAAADLQRAVRLYHGQEDQFNAESLQSNLGLVYWTMGDLDAAEKSLQASISYYRKTGSDQLITFDIGNLGLVYFARGELDQALKLTREHIEHAQKLSFISEYNRGLRNLGTVLYYYGEYQEAIRVLTICHSYYEKRGSRPAYWLDVVWLGLCRGALGEHEKGLGMVREVLQRSRDLGSQVLEQVTLRSLAYFSPPEARREILQRSLELALATDRKLEQAAVYLMLAGTSDGEPQDWLAGCDLLRQIGAEKWLVGYSIENPPFIPLLI
jgi:tetratricopeptide (TPR) repeat protein